MGNSLPTKEMGPALPSEEIAPAPPSEEMAPALPSEEIAPALPSEEVVPVSEQGGGTSEVPITQGPVIRPETGGVSLEAGPVEEDPSESGSSILGTSPSYAAHVEGPEAALSPPPQEPSPGVDRFDPSPVSAAVAEARPEVVTVPDQAEDDWGPWRAQNAASSEAQDGRDVKRPRRGIPSGSRALVGAVPTPNESEEDLLKQVFQRELEVRRQEGEALGLRLRAEADEPLPLLSHFYGPPSPSQVYDSLALCLTDRSYLTRVALGGGGSSEDLVGGATGVRGRNRLPRPEEYGEPTPYVPPRPPLFPEEEPKQRPQQKLLIDQATITENALEEWHSWLKMAKQGRSLREWGLTSADVIAAVEYLGEAPPQEEPPRGGRWTNAPRGGGRKKNPPPEYPTSIGTLLYLKKALKAIDAFDGSPSGYRGLLLGPSSAIGLEKPDGSTASDEREAWKYLAASVALRVQRLLIGQKESEEPHGECYDGYLVADPESCSREAAASAAADADHACRGKLGLLFGGCVRSLGRVAARREGVAESIGILRSLGTEMLWQPGVITRVFGTPALPARQYPEVGAAAALGETSAGDASSSNPAAGIAAGTPAMAPPTPAATPGMIPPTPAGTEPKSPASLASVIHRPGMLVAKTLLASDGSTVPLPPGVPPRHVLPQPPPPPSKSPSAQPPQDPLVPSKGQTQQERGFTLPSPLGVASSAPSGATASETGTQFADYEAVVEAAKAAMARASRDL